MGFAWAMLSSTELPWKGVDLAEMRSGGLGRCRRFFWLGVAFDAVGVAVLFTGVFGNLLFYDMLLYLGSIIIFVSLLWWIFWYTGNIEALPEDPWRRSSPGAGEVGVHRSSSLRFSLTLRSVSNTFQRIHRRRRRRRLLLPRVIQTISSHRSTDPGQLERNSDARTKSGTSFHPAKAVSVLNQLQLCSGQASRSLPLVPLHPPLSVCTSRSQPVFSSQCYPSGCYSQMALSSDSHVPVDLDTQRRCKISVTSRVYPLERADSQSHLLVPMPFESFPGVPKNSQSQIQGSLAQESQLQNLPPTSQTQPETVKASMQVPVVTPGFAQTSQSRSPGVQEVPKNSSAKALETLPATSRKRVQDQPDPSLPVSEVIHTNRQCDPTGNLPASRGVRKSHPF